MNVIMFSRDPQLFVEGSAFRARAREYATLFSSLVIIAPKKQTSTTFEENNLKGIPVAGMYGMWRAGARAIKDKKRDVVLTAQDEIGAVVAYTLSARYGVRWQYQIHTDMFNPYFVRHSVRNKIRTLLARFLIVRASGVRVVSERIRKSIERKFNVQGKITVLPIAIPTERLEALRTPRSYEYKDGDFVILMVSRLAAEKNITLAIRAFERVLKKHPSSLLRIVGDGPERKNLENFVISRNLGTRVQFEGWVADPITFYRSDHCFLSTSWYEGYGLSVVEAMLAGMPIVMTNTGIAGELIKDSVSGSIVEPGDEDGLADAMMHIITDYSLRWRFGTEAQAATQQLLTWPEYAKQFYHSLEI